MNGKVKGMGKFGEGFLDIKQDGYYCIHGHGDGINNEEDSGYCNGFTYGISSTEDI
jgi:hypothetical protein